MRKSSTLLLAALATSLFAVVPAWATTVTLDSTKIQDNAIYSGWPNWEGGQCRVDSVYGINTLVQFDLAGAGIPIGPNTVIDSATYVVGTGYWSMSAGTIDAYLVKQPWTETGSTWYSYDGVNPWETPGATGPTDIVTGAPVAQFVTAAYGENWAPNQNAWDITAAAQAWADGTAANHGLLLTSTTPGYNSIWVDADRVPDTGWNSVMPTLVVTYHETPEPATMALLAIGGAGMLIRRRRAAA